MNAFVCANRYIGEREDNFNDDPSSPPESDLWVPSSSSRKRKNSDSEDSPIAKTKVLNSFSNAFIFVHVF